MSKPENMLASFQTYSYHHILLVTNNTKTAEFLSNEATLSQLEHNTSQKERFGLKHSASGEYIVLINNMTDAQFTITSATWNNIMSPNESTRDGISQASLMQLDGTIEIVEPLGARFLNEMTRACDKLESDPAGLIFVLKTIFVGYNDQHTGDRVSSITNIRALLFSPIDISAVFDSTGAKYKIEFFGISNGYGKTIQASKITQGLDFQIDATTSLTATLDSLAAEINRRYRVFEQRLINNGSIKKGNYRRVEYAIKTSGYTDKYKAGTNEKANLDDTEKNPIMQFAKDAGVEQIIQRIVLSSAEIVKENVVESGSKKEKKYIYKITSTLSSTDKLVTLTYIVNKHEIAVDPNTYSLEHGQEGLADGFSVLELDYIFTGKNTDILNFDIKMEMGLAFFQTVATSNIPDGGQIKDTLKMTKGASTGGNAKKSTDPRTKTPLFLGSVAQDMTTRNVRYPKSTIDFQTMLNRHAAMENIEASVTIRGNPQLLDELISTTTDILDSEAKPGTGTAINSKWMSKPTLAKINIKMPIDPNNEAVGFEDFWYTGFYTIFAVKNIFTGGDFTQELEMFSLPNVVPGDEAEAKETTTENNGESTTTSAGTSEQTTASVPVEAAPVQSTNPPPSVAGDMNQKTVKSRKQLRQSASKIRSRANPNC